MKDATRRFRHILEGHTPEVVELAESLRQMVFAAVPGIREEVRDGYSDYGTNGVAFAITVHKDHVNLQFYYGTSLSDPNQLLHGIGKRLRHVTIRQARDIRADYLGRLVCEAVALDSP